MKMKTWMSVCIVLSAGILLADDLIWSGEKIIDSPIEFKRDNLKLKPGTKIQFKGKGSLSLSGGKFICDNVNFSADEVMNGGFRIILSNTMIEVNNCNFNGIRSKDPEKYVEGAIRVQYGNNARFTGNTFTNCSAIAFLNAREAIFEKNTFNSPETGIYIFNASENRVIGNTFEKASVYGISLNGAKLNTIENNRFTDCKRGIHLTWESSGNKITGNCFFGGVQGIMLWGVGENNLFFGNLFEKLSGTAFDSNAGIAIGKNNIFSNNVINRCGTAFSMPKQPIGNDILIRNNAICSTEISIFSNGGIVKAPNNLLWNIKHGSISRNNAEIIQENTVKADPKFKDIENGDYRPDNDSPLLKSGTNGSNIGLFQ